MARRIASLLLNTFSLPKQVATTSFAINRSNESPLQTQTTCRATMTECVAEWSMKWLRCLLNRISGGLFKGAKVDGDGDYLSSWKKSWKRGSQVSISNNPFNLVFTWGLIIMIIGKWGKRYSTLWVTEESCFVAMGQLRIKLRLIIIKWLLKKLKSKIVRWYLWYTRFCSTRQLQSICRCGKYWAGLTNILVL